MAVAYWLVASLVVMQAGGSDSVLLTETLGRGGFLKCETSIHLYGAAVSYMVVNCQPAVRGSRNIYRYMPLSREDFDRYQALVAEADFLGGGYVAEVPACEDCLLAQLGVVQGNKEALLLVTGNPTFTVGARARLLEILQSTRERVFREGLAEALRSR